MKFLNSNYANFKKGQTYQSPFGPQPEKNPITNKRSRRSSSYDPAMAASDKNTRTAAREARSNSTFLAKAKSTAKSTLAKAGKFIKKNKVGVGLAAAGALGAAGYGVYRKMRSDKGKKRGQYSK